VNRADRRSILKTFFLSVWGMVTMVLLFVVVLLVMEMVQQGQDPLRSLRPPGQQAAQAPATPPMPALGTREVLLYFASPGGHGLVSERRELEVSDSSHENCRRALEALAAGPSDGGAPILPEELKLRALYLLESGELVIDFTRQAAPLQRRARGVAMESLLVYGVANTLAQAPLQGSRDASVRTVRFLIDGQPPQDSLPWHLDLDEPISPDLGWVEQAAGAGADG